MGAPRFEGAETPTGPVAGEIPEGWAAMPEDLITGTGRRQPAPSGPRGSEQGRSPASASSCRWWPTASPPIRKGCREGSASAANARLYCGREDTQDGVRFVKLIAVVAVVSAALVTQRPVTVEAQTDELCDSFATDQFSDVDPGDYGAEYILCMKTLGMSLGRGDGGYGPDAELTRSQMASFIVRLWRDVLNRLCPEGPTPFTDVASGNTHAANINCVYNLGITKGTTTTTYAPAAPLTASQISRFLLRTYEKVGNTCPALASELDKAVTCLQSLRVIPTTAEGRSNEAVTRAQMAVYVVGLWHNIAGRGLPPPPPELGSEPLPDSPDPDGADTEEVGLVLDLLEGLVIAAEERIGYDRDLFPHWSDLDRDGCDTRREVLIRDSRVESGLDPNRTCWIVSGLWYSYYDDEWLEGPSALDIDHLVPLAEAWDSGASGWSRDQREAFANDEGALLAVTASSNRSKGASDPAEWMPPNEDFTCPYVAAWVATKAKWGLTLDRRESDFLNGLLAGECAGTTLSIETPVLAFPILDAPILDTPILDTPILDTPGQPGIPASDVPPNPGNSKNCGDFSTRTEAQEWFDTYFPHYGDVARLDGDGDGMACESLP